MRAMLKVWPVTGPSQSSESEAERGARSNLSDNLEKNILQINAMMATSNEIWLSTLQLQNAGILQKALQYSYFYLHMVWGVVKGGKYVKL